MFTKFQKIILITTIVVFVLLLVSQTTIGEKIYFPGWLGDKIRSMMAEVEFSAEDYKDGTIILVKPIATGVGDGRYEAGDIVEIRDGAEMYERFGKGEFLGKKEKEKLLPLYYPAKLTEEMKRQLMEPEYETFGGLATKSQIGGDDERTRDDSLTMVKRRKYGIDYTLFLTEKEILKARSQQKLKRIPEVELSAIINKEAEQISVIEMPIYLSLAEFANQKIDEIELINRAYAATASTSIVDPGNGPGTDYLSLNAWEAAQQGNLVTADEIAIATCRSTGGTADTVAVTIDGWTTDATHYIKIWTDPAEGYRHNGVWDDTKYRHSHDGNAIYVREGFVRIDGLQINLATTGASLFAGVYTELTDAYASVDIRISNNIIKYSGSSTFSQYGIYLSLDAEKSNAVTRIWNNIIYGFTSGSSSSGIRLEEGDETAYVYNNTVSGCLYGLRRGTGTFISTNNVVFNNTDDFYGTITCDYCASDDADATTYTNGIDWANEATDWTANFTDYTNGDFHLKSTAPDLIDAGTDLSATFTTDIDGETRSAPWDIGADEYFGTVINSSQSDRFTNGLVGHWTFDGPDMYNNVADVSGNGNHGSLVLGATGNTSTTTAIGKLGQALEFDGLNDGVQIESNASIEISDNITLSAWVFMHTDSLNGRKIICKFHCGISADVHYLLQIYPDYTNFRLGIGGATKNLNSDDIPVNQWSFLVGTYDGVNMRIYNNGLETNSVAQTGAIDTDVYPLVIGNNGQSSGGVGTDSARNFDGIIDDVRIYNRALSADEIGGLYRMGQAKLNAPQNTRQTTGLVGHWTFDGPDMYQNVADVSGYGKHGYLNGQTSTTTAIGKLGQALEFDGVNDYVSVGSVYNGVKTISFWLRTDQSYSKKIIDIDATDQIELNGSSNIVATSFPSPTVYVDGTVASAIATSTWHFITITDSTGVNVSAMDIGRVSAGYFDGQIDDIRMYSSVLSASEIGQLYRTGSVKFRQ